MSRSRKSVKDEIDEERTTAAKSKRKRKTAHVSEPLQELAREHGLVPASELPAQLPPPELELLPLKREVIDAPPELEDPQQGSHASKITGPRPRVPGEPGSVFTSVDGGFRLMEDGRRRFFAFEDDRKPAADEKQDMQEAGMPYQPVEKIWSARATPEIRERSDALALKFSGKAETIRGGR